LRQQTENIGLTRLSSGLELIRIGKPLAPEFAAWRYGREIRRRYRDAMAWTITGGIIGGGGAAIAVTGGLLSGQMPWFMVPMFGVWGLAIAASFKEFQSGVFARNRAIKDAIRVPNGTERPYALYPGNLRETALVPEESPNLWSISLVHARGRDLIRGDAAPRALGVLLARINRTGGSAVTVQDAVNAIARAGGSAGYPAQLARRYAPHHAEAERKIAYNKRYAWGDFATDPAALPNLPAELRLALEMAVHEDTEQRAIDGDLAALEAAWREAEEIAAIADDLLLPQHVQSWMAQNAKRRSKV
jgi:hypothetical protein